MKIITITKPSIVLGNIFTFFGGYCISICSYFNTTDFLKILLGIILILACSCSFNNYLDKDIDKFMKRTKKRPTAYGKTSSIFLINYSIILGITGILILYNQSNIKTIITSIVGSLTYIIIYTIYYKRTSSKSLFWGSLSGATPPLIGYISTTNKIDIIGLTILFTLIVWQVPHFLSISIYRNKDYYISSIPILTKKYKKIYIKFIMFTFTIIYTISNIVINFIASLNNIHIIISMIFGTIWIILSLIGFYTKNISKWSRKMFIISIINILLINITLAI